MQQKFDQELKKREFDWEKAWEKREDTLKELEKKYSSLEL